MRDKKIDIVLQATGEHAWGVGGGWVNAAKHLGILNRAFFPKGRWGDIDPIDDDGLFLYLERPHANCMLLMGMDWHSQMLHMTPEWRSRWIDTKCRKVLYIQESIMNFERLTGKRDMLNAFLSASKLVDAVIYTDPMDKALMEHVEKPSHWMPFGVDTSIFHDSVPLQNRKNNSFFRGKIKPFSKESEYFERRKLLKLLLKYKIVEHAPYTRGKVPPEDLALEFNRYRIAVNLPSVFAGHPTRVTEAMACGCALVTSKTNIPEADRLFIHGEDLFYYETENELVSCITRLIENEELTVKISENGKRKTIDRFSLTSQLEQVTEWVTSLSSDSLSVTLPRAAFIDHYYHRITHSSLFFIRLLSRFYDIDIYWDESPAGKPLLDGKSIGSSKYDVIFVWQCIHCLPTLEPIQNEQVFFLPMYDHSGLKHGSIFLKGPEYISLSQAMHQKLIHEGCKSRYLQYFPEPNDYPDHQRSFSNLKGFFWQRTPDINWSIIKKLLTPGEFESLHVHNAPDSNNCSIEAFPSEWRGMPITSSDWLKERKDYYNLLKGANIFFVPRIEEGIGMAMLEAMAMGMCVVAPRRPTMNEYIHHNVNGLLYDIENPQPLDFSCAEKLGRTARQCIEEGRIKWLKQSRELISDLTGLKDKNIEKVFSTPVSTPNETNSWLPENVREVDQPKLLNFSVEDNLNSINILIGKFARSLCIYISNILIFCKLSLLERVFRKVYRFLILKKNIYIIKKSGLFLSSFYLTHYPDVASSGMHPIHHFLLYGANEGRKPNPFFDPTWYCEQYYDVKQSGMNPLLHYILLGKKEGRSPEPSNFKE